DRTFAHRRRRRDQRWIRKTCSRSGNTRPADRVTKDGRAKLRHLEASNNCKPSASPLDVPVAEIGLKRPRIVALVRQGEAAGVAQHMRVRLQLAAGGLA